MKNYKRTIFSWSMYDFANQPFTTLVVTFIFGTYFTEMVAENSILGTFQWSWGISITALIIACLSPIMGAIADQGGLRKLFLIFWTLICVIGSLMLYDSVSGKIFYSLFWFVFGNVGFEMGSVFCNAYLPSISPKEKMGRISGYGWSLGYAGGLLALIICLIFLVYPEKPIFNLSKHSSVNSISLKINDIKYSVIEGNTYSTLSVDTIAENYKYIKLIDFEKSDTTSNYQTLVYAPVTYDKKIKWNDDSSFIVESKIPNTYNKRKIVLVGAPIWATKDSAYLIDSTGYIFPHHNSNFEIRNQIFKDKNLLGTICYDRNGKLFLNKDEEINKVSENLSSQNIRFTNILVGIWFLIFSIPTFLYVKDSKVNIKSKGIIKESFSQIRLTFNSISNYKEIVKFLIARIFYNDGLITIFAFGGIYAAGTFDFTFNEIFIFGIILSISAGIGAFLMGFVDDFIGSKKTIQISNLGLVIACLIAIFGNDMNIGEIFIPGKNFLWLSGVLIGVFAGSNQSASRSLMGHLTPKDKQNEFFGFYAFSGKATSFLGPLLLGIVTQLTGSQRYGLLVIVILILLGFYILNKVEIKTN